MGIELSILRPGLIKVGIFSHQLSCSEGKYLFEKASVSVKKKCWDRPKAEIFEISLSPQSSGSWGSFIVLSSDLCGIKGIIMGVKHCLLSNACIYRATEAI